MKFQVRGRNMLGSLRRGVVRLLIQCICSYPPYLEAVSSIRSLRTRRVVVKWVLLGE
jgi:hypothetical protein